MNTYDPIATKMRMTDEYLAFFTYCYNSTPNSNFNFNYSPFELVYAKKPNIPEHILTGKTDPLYNIDNFSKEMKFRLQKTHTEIRNFLEKSKETNKTAYDTKTNSIQIKINDKILLQSGARHTLDSIYTGPYIVKNITDTNVTIFDEKSKKYQTVHKNRIRKYKT